VSGFPCLLSARIRSQAFEKSLADPDDDVKELLTEIHLTMGKLLLETGKIPMAEEHFNEAVKNADAVYGPLGTCLMCCWHWFFAPLRVHTQAKNNGAEKKQHTHTHAHTEPHTHVVVHWYVRAVLRWVLVLCSECCTPCLPLGRKGALHAF
jgi:hypothetical protein